MVTGIFTFMMVCVFDSNQVNIEEKEINLYLKLKEIVSVVGTLVPSKLAPSWPSQAKKSQKMEIDVAGRVKAK